MDINRNLPKLFESQLNGLRAASETAHRGERKEKQSRQRMYIWVFFTFSFFRGGAGGAKKAQKLSSRELKVQSGKEDEKRRNNDYDCPRLRPGDRWLAEGRLSSFSFRS